MGEAELALCRHQRWLQTRSSHLASNSTLMNSDGTPVLEVIKHELPMELGVIRPGQRAVPHHRHRSSIAESNIRPLAVGNFCYLILVKHNILSIIIIKKFIFPHAICSKYVIIFSTKYRPIDGAPACFTEWPGLNSPGLELTYKILRWTDRQSSKSNACRTGHN